MKADFVTYVQGFERSLAVLRILLLPKISQINGDKNWNSSALCPFILCKSFTLPKLKLMVISVLAVAERPDACQRTSMK